MNHDTLGEVWLVGAGCGAADLITVRGLRLIQRCDAIVYDDLIDEALLREAPVHAERVYMGKRSGHHSAPQAEICAELIRQARLGRMVVRLKGGDPYLFGRGGEEMLALRAADTADTADGLPEEFDRVAQMEGTLVILMGLAQLERIAQRLMAARKPGETPAAVLSGGNSKNPACVRGTLKTIAQAARAQQVQPPAIIVIGEVAAMELNP